MLPLCKKRIVLKFNVQNFKKKKINTTLSYWTSQTVKCCIENVCTTKPFSSSKTASYII